MRTEQLLRDILGDLADQARTPELTLARVTAGLPRRSGRQRRRTLVLVAAAIVVLALAVAVPTFLVNRTAEPVGRVPGNWNLTHRVELPPGWEVRTQNIVGDSEESIYGDTGDVNTACTVHVNGPGQADPTGMRDSRTPVTVNGRPGWWAPNSPIELAGVSWEYERNAYALVSCGEEQSPDVAVDFAERVRFEPVVVRLPFRLRSLPAGYTTRFVTPSITSSEGTFLGGVQFQGEDQEVRGFSVAATPGRTEIPPAIPGWETDTVAGRPVVLSARDAKLCFNPEGYTACIQAGEGEAEDLTKSLWAAGRRELLVDVAKRLVLADDLDDPSTWFPANRAIPR